MFHPVRGSRLTSRRHFLFRVRDLALAAAVPTSAWALSGGRQARAFPVLGRTNAEMLLRMCRQIVPLRRVTLAPYRAVVRALDAQAAADGATLALLTEGAATAQKQLGRRWHSLPDRAIARYLKTIAATPFFRLMMGTALPTLVNDRRVWKAVGYPGESYTRGGYLRRGFNDLDWLPEPPASVMGPMP